MHMFTARKLLANGIPSLLKQRQLLLLLIIYAQLCLAAIQLPYGLEEGDEHIQFPTADGQQIIARSLPDGHQFTFFERSHNKLFISRNGAISFDLPFDTNAKELDLERKDIIAVFYSQSLDGAIFYRHAEGNTLLAKELSAKIRRAFSANQFEADFVVLVTWDELLDEQSQANTFQLALAANSNETYALLVYSTIKWSKVAERFAQAGFFSTDGRSEKLLNSGGPSIGDVIRVTNFNEPGMYIYRVSGTHPIDPRFGLQKAREGGEEEYEYQQEQQEYEQEDQIGECPPDPYRDNCPPNCNLVLDDNHCSLCICSKVPLPSLTADTAPLPPAAAPQQTSLRTPDLSCIPEQGRAQCHTNANCLQQQQSGYCCECENNYFGNGVECLPKEGPLRINGHFEAAINGKTVQRSDIFSYIQPQEGQQHTALAKIQPEFGWSLLLLDSLSTQFGWLFAKTKQGRQQNGFELTGGNFTRIVNIHLGDRYALIIRQEFTDRQFNEHFDVNMFVSGTLPELQGPVHVSIPEFEETYKRERPGLIRAYSERFIMLRGNGSPVEETKFRVTTDQQIHFTECSYKSSPTSSQTTIKFERLNANYNEAEMVVRFASQSSVLGEFGGTEQRLHGIHVLQENACTSGHHFCTLPNMICVPIHMNPFYRCECRSGYRLIEDNTVEQRMACQQIDEQSENIVQPLQQLQQTTPPIVLQAGECTRHDQCHQWGECVFGPMPGLHGKCKCRGWYIGDGVAHCGPPEQPPPAAVQPQPADKSTICRGDNECGDNAKCDYSTSHGYYVCICKEGWQGDGIDCAAVPEPALNDDQQTTAALLTTTTTEKMGENLFNEEGKKQCTDSSDCHPFGSCIFSEETNSYFCACLPGYQGNGVDKCERSEECSPTDPSQACPNANQECNFDHSLQKFACQCRSGYTKQPDGKCTYELDAQTNQCQLCGANAQCVRAAHGWNCICNPGFTGNGFDCRKKATCLDEPTICSANAQCLPNGQQSYDCICNYGYVGDGRNCEPSLQRRETETLLIGRGMTIIQRPVQANESGRQLIVQPHQIVVDIDYDCSTGRIYWSDISGHSIRSSLLNGTGINVQFSDILRSPEGIAIDPLSQNIYYLDSIKNELGVLSANGRFQKALLKNGLNNPRALVIDLEGRQLFYSDWSREGPKIGRIGLDGSDNQIFISDDVVLPNGLVLLQQRKWLCWVDAGNQKLSCVGLDGTGRRVIYSPLQYPFGLTINNQEERFYWTDWKDQKIHSVDVFGKEHIEFMPGAGGRGKLYGILSMPVKCPNMDLSGCRHQNGGCAHWCLSGSRSGSSSCVCPENVKGLEGC